MIQFNLLPDVKLQYLKARRLKRLVISISGIAVVASLALLLLLVGTVYVFQKKNLNDLDRDIKTYSSQLQNTPNLDKVLTVQNQLNVLTTLHDQKPVASRLFGYLKQLTPSDASISQLSVDYTQNTISFTGSAKSLDIVNTFVDTLKFTTYTNSSSSSSTSAPNAFKSVVLSQFSVNNAGAQYTITANFDPTIFSSASNVNLTVPNIISTRSAVEQPTDLFQSTKPGGQ